ncbi:helix-turn-helix transcriptional regulator [Methylophilus methylotrophus]|uniref:helix-turn-helix transcriptional regulator n=1 Tax=Methylophilus methylotrophus TaxID=17 RepID=UPI000374EF99|nr:helix-turn-helix domain-containing protein [Methylophilus methylotrophus]
MQFQSQLLSTPQAAKFLNVSIAFLERDRWAGAKIPFVKVGSRAVRYRLQDLQNYIDQHVQSGSEVRHD